MSARFDALVVGDYCVDLVFTGMPRFLEPGKEIMATGFERTPGGGGYIVATGMNRLGLKVGWAVDFGEDEFSRYACEQALAEGLDDSLFVMHKGPLRRVTVAASYPQDRAFLTYFDPDPPVPAAMKALATCSALAVFIPGLYHGPFFEAGRLLARAKGMKLVMDGNTNESLSLETPGVRRVLRSVDLFMPNALEARGLTGREDLREATRVLADLCALVVVKDGVNGAFACDGKDLMHMPAVRVMPVDTTGSGDCFDAGFFAAWIAGKDLGTCVQWGNVVGGLSTLAPGGTGRKVMRAEVEAWVASFPDPERWYPTDR